jgi:uncharacterized PurR-regulated membrane protein YhhQ (DUF165 family)
VSAYRLRLNLTVVGYVLADIWPGLVAAFAYVGTVVAANWAITHYGMVPVGFGLLAPAGVYFAGLAFTLRDVTQHSLGKLATVAAILAGSALSYAVGITQEQVPGLPSPLHLAVASACAFLLSELADFAVYTPLRRKGWLPAVVASNVVGLVVDSALFLWLAFGSLAFLAGQVVGKGWMTALAVVLLLAVNRRRKEAIA